MKARSSSQELNRGRRFALRTLALSALGAALVGRAGAVELRLVKILPSDVVLEWMGGAAPYEVLRGTIRDGSDLASVETISGNQYTDPGALDDGLALVTYRVAARTPTLSELQQTIFTPSCAKSGCHSGALPTAGMLLTDGSTHTSVVGVTSLEQPSLSRVEPFDPEASYLVRKVLANPAINGLPMPADGPPFLDLDRLEALKSWIAAGAPDD